MKMLLPLALTVALLRSAAALQCQTCSNADCSSSMSTTCFAEAMCILASGRVTTSGSSSEFIHKGCGTAALCSMAGHQTYSANLGSISMNTLALCCTTDNCNQGNDLSYVPSDENNMKCHTCDPSDANCTDTVNCRGSETSCFRASLRSGTSVHGCISENLCEVASTHGGLPMMQSLGRIAGGVSCCSGSLCDPKTVTVPTTLAPPPVTCKPSSGTAGRPSRVLLGGTLLLLGAAIYTLH